MPAAPKIKNAGVLPRLNLADNISYRSPDCHKDHRQKRCNNKEQGKEPTIFPELSLQDKQNKGYPAKSYCYPLHFISSRSLQSLPYDRPFQEFCEIGGAPYPHRLSRPSLNMPYPLKDEQTPREWGRGHRQPIRLPQA